jgi:ethanolamine ammonia-lyase large subunit
MYFLHCINHALRTTHLAARLQPNHPTDDMQGIAASLLDGLM